MTDHDTDRAGLFRGMAVAEIERRYGKPILWRLGLAAPPNTRKEGHSDARPVKDRRALTGSALPASPSPARTSPSIRTRAVSTVGRATGAQHARGAAYHRSSGTTDE